MEKLKNIIVIMKDYVLKENIKMEKKMEMVKLFIIMVK